MKIFMYTLDEPESRKQYPPWRSGYSYYFNGHILFCKKLYYLWETNPGIYSKESILVGNKILTIHSAGMN